MPAALTPEQTFGFGSVPLASYFKAPKGGSRNTQFAPQARAMLQQDEAYQQEQRQMEADQLVNDLLGQASELSDEQINQTLIQNPNIFRGRGAEAIQGYQQFRQQAVTPADQRLGTYFYTKIQEDKDPRHIQNFQRRMLDEGMSANDAWEAYRTDQFNEPLMQQLAEAGVPREQFDTFRSPTGHFDPVEVSRGVAQARAAAKASGLGKKAAEPIDEEIELLKDAMEQRKKRLEAVGGDLTKDTVFLDYADSLDKAYGQKRTALRPPASTPTSKISSVTNLPGVIPTVPLEAAKTPEERKLVQSYADKRAQESQKIEAAWMTQKQTLGEQMRDAYKGNNDDLLLAAQAVLNDELMPVALLDENAIVADDSGAVVRPKYSDFLLQNVGRKPFDTAFAEPDNKRWGTQDVSNEELLKAWAKDYVALTELAKGATGQKMTGKIKSVTPIE